MPKYTTGELAKQCHVSVRTVQYYDKRGILTPSELSEGGRRLYSQQDLETCRLICTLRALNLSIDVIKQIFEEPDAKDVIAVLLGEHAEKLRAEVKERQQQLDKLDRLRQGLSKLPEYTIQTVGDMADSMENRKKLRKTFAVVLTLGIIMDVIEIGTLILWIAKGIWLPFAIGMPLVVVMGIVATRLYYKNAAYICPHCHTVFRPKFRQFFFSRHTLRARKLTCPQCGRKGFCIETAAEREQPR